MRKGKAATKAAEDEAVVNDQKPSAAMNEEEAKVEKEKEPPKKKAKFTKATTMVVTAKEGADLLKGENLGDTRSGSKQKAKATKPSMKRFTTIDQVVAEAKAAFGSIDTSEGRVLRKRPASSASTPKASLKKAGTMQKTAKEGKEFLKRGQAKKAV